jgi:hypothetical protein
MNCGKLKTILTRLALVYNAALQAAGERYSPTLYENINTNRLYFTKTVKGKLSKISKSSFERRQYHSSSNDNLLGHYLAGLIEGDGSIIVPKTIRNQKGKLLYPVVKITFVDKDAPLAMKIKESLNGGTLVYPKDSRYLNLLFQDLNSVQKMAVLLNGKMRTPKIEALGRLIDWLNARLDEKSKIVKLGLDNSSLGNNPWLTGFIEADGNFYCSFDLNLSIAEVVKNYMRISQKQLYKITSDIPLENNSNFQIMKKMREFLGVKTVNEIKRTRDNFVELSYEVRTTKKTSCNLLINYLSVYPLFSSKHQDFLDWREFHRIRLSREYRTLEGTSKLIYLKNSMNTKRTQFNWDSLSSFYC